MKIKITIIGIIILACIGLVYANMDKKYSAVIVERTTFENSIASMAPQKMANPGKIFIQDNLLFIVEKYYGVHIINNMYPENPEKIGFIRILGCTDIAVKNNTMFASSAVDLVTIDITDKDDVKEIDRQKNVLPELVSPDGSIDSRFSNENRPENTIIIAWK